MPSILIWGWGQSPIWAACIFILTVKDSFSITWPCFPPLHGLSVEHHPRFPQRPAVLWNNPFSHPMSPAGQSELFLIDLSLPLSPVRMKNTALEYRSESLWASLPDSPGNQYWLNPVMTNTMESSKLFNFLEMLKTTEPWVGGFIIILLYRSFCCNDM